ncbi:MAG: hypothetical protein UD103_07515 [Bacteroidales bacterium]|nr:hypothetical protein [Bacteroidales bacterium]
MKQLNQVLGYYTPAFFKIQINTNQDIDPNNLSGQNLSTFIHEYTHFIQDFTTIKGLENIYLVYDILREYCYQIYNNKTNFITLPLNIQIANHVYMMQIISYSWGTNDNINQINNINSVETTTVEFDQNAIAQQSGLANFNKIKLNVDTNIGNVDLEFGTLAIMEGMSHLMETFLNPNHITNAPDYPYNIAQKFAQHIYPTISDEMIFALCDIALQTSAPGESFYTMLLDIQKDNINNADDIYKKFNDVFKTWTKGIVNYAKEVLSTVINGDFATQYKAWANNIFNTAINLRTNNPKFFLNIIRGGQFNQNKEFKNFVNSVGTPLMFNNYNKAFKIPINNTQNWDVEFFTAISYIFNLLQEGTEECPLIEWCKQSSIQIDKNCSLNPTAHSSNYREPCPIGMIWYHWDLSKWDLSKWDYQIGLKKKCVLKRLKENFIKSLRLYTTKKGV